MSYGRCGNELCACTVAGEDYCGAYCEDRGEALEVEGYEERCGCGHPACSKADAPK
jgi:hypothetical protein